MKKIISLLLAAVMVFSVAVTLTGCGAPEDAGAEISVYLGEEVFDFDPTDYYVDSNAAQVLSLLYEPLFKITESGKLKCAAADDYSVDKEKRQIVIELEETYWSDEVRVTAADYIYAWRDIILEPNNPNPAAALFYDIENAVSIKSGDDSIYSFGAVATGTYEITINYNEGADYKQILRNLASVAASPAREDIITNAKTYWSKSVSSIVTNGPFKLEAINGGTGEFTLARNLGYHQQSSVEDYDNIVNPAALVSFFSPDGSPIEITYSDVEAKTVFYMGNATLADRAANSAKASVGNSFSTYSYLFNVENPLFAIANVRRALSLAINRKEIEEAVTFGTAADGFLTPTVSEKLYDDEAPSRISTDAAMVDAKALLASVNFEGISKKFTLTVNNDEESIRIAELCEAAWEELGFDVTVKTVYSTTTVVMDSATATEMTIEDSTIQTLIKEASYGKRNFDVIALDWQMYSDDAFVALASLTSHMNGNGRDFSTGSNRTSVGGWSNFSFDTYMNRAYSAKTDKDRREVLITAEKIILESCPIIPILYNENFYFNSKDLSNIEFDYFGNVVFTEAKQKNYKDYLKDNNEE